MIGSFIWVHAPFYILPMYFIFYTTQRMIKHWRDGRERARVSSGRLVAKTIATVCCAILELIHIADYSPNVSYSAEELAFRTCYFLLSGIAWLFSSILVYFDYTRGLPSQWRGQRLFWVLELFSNVVLLGLNIVFQEFEYDGEDFYQFYLIQILSYTMTIVSCCLLSYYAVFRPNDFSVINSPPVYYPLERKPRPLPDEANISRDSEINFKLSITGYKIKPVMNSSIIHYNINICINDTARTISRSLMDFEFLDKSLREQFSGNSFPDFSISTLRNSNVEDRGQALCVYLSSLCCSDFMTPDLLNFLQIEGNYRDILTYKHMQAAKELHVASEFTPRSESTIQSYHYRPPALVSSETNIKTSSHLQWIVKISIPSFRLEESTQSTDFYVKCEIPGIGFEKTRPFKLVDFANLHRCMKKVLHPTNMIAFPSKSNSFGKSDGMESQRALLEYYLTEIYNDPAYICKEALDFIGCDAELDDILSLIPDYTYKIVEDMSWEGGISEDSNSFISFPVGIGKKAEGALLEKEWKCSRRYREFDAMNKRLVQRQSSWMLKNYTLFKGRVYKDIQIPSLPGKKISPLSTHEEIVERKNGLERYLQELITNPLVTSSFAFREFIDEKN